ncbi:MAG: response regulator [Proteobacteria bacterium]|nr:response regulator [Pseudomonadota bacterium]
MTFRRSPTEAIKGFLRKIANAEYLTIGIAILVAFLVFLDPFFCIAQQLPKGGESLILPTTIASSDSVPQLFNQTPDLIFGLFIGVLLTAALYLFFIWAVIQDRSQIFLMLMLLCLAFNMAGTNDSMMQLLGITDHAMRNLLQSYSTILAYFFSLFFTYYFLELDLSAPIMRFPFIFIGGILLLLLALASFVPPLVYMVLPPVGVLALSLILLSGLIAIHLGSSGALGHLIAFTSFLGGTMAMPLHDLGYIYLSETAKKIAYSGYSVAALMFAIVIAVQFASRQEEKEKELEVSNERFSLAARGSNEGLFDWNARTDDSYISDQFRKIVGLNRDLTPKKLREWVQHVVPSDRNVVFKALHKLKNAKGTSTINFELRVMRNHNDHCWIHCKVIAVKDFNTSRFHRLVGSIGDITSRKRSEAELRASEVRFRSITEAHPVPVLIANLNDGQILYASPGAEVLLGLPGTTLISHKLERFIARSPERSDIFESIRNNEEINMREVHVTLGDDEVIPAAVSARKITYRNESAIVIGLYDLTEKKEAERQIAQQQEALQQSEKMAALGGLLAGVAHELNNPLSVVMGQTTLLIEGQADEKIKTRADKIYKAADRCSRIVKSFLALARRKPPEHKDIDIAIVIQSSLDLLGYQIRNENITLKLNVAENMPPVIGDVDQITQVIINLAMNATQAMHGWEGAHNLSIEACLEPEGTHILISIIDTGPGVPEEIRHKIFEPFFTTKGTGGTGVGLALCLNIIAGHGGQMIFEETPGGGATFRIRLPVSKPTGSAKEGEAATSDTVGRKMRLLLVDDEIELAQTLADLLEPNGHEIDLAANGKIALDKLRKNSFDAIVSDLRMPVMDGPTMYAEIAKEMPQYIKKIIYVTGDTLSPHVNAFLKDTPVPVIEKPYKLADVQEALAKLLKENETQSNMGSVDSPAPAPHAEKSDKT